jgi:hypothetical protein
LNSKIQWSALDKESWHTQAIFQFCSAIPGLSLVHQDQSFQLTLLMKGSWMLIGSSWHIELKTQIVLIESETRSQRFSVESQA